MRTEWWRYCRADSFPVLPAYYSQCFVQRLGKPERFLWKRNEKNWNLLYFEKTRNIWNSSLVEYSSGSNWSIRIMGNGYGHVISVSDHTFPFFPFKLSSPAKIPCSSRRGIPTVYDNTQKTFLHFDRGSNQSVSLECPWSSLDQRQPAPVSRQKSSSTIFHVFSSLLLRTSVVAL